MKLRLTRAAAIAVLWLVLAAGPGAFAQGCALCYQTALNASPGGQRALSRAVVVLLIPPVGMMALLVGAGAAYARKRDRRPEEPTQD